MLETDADRIWTLLAKELTEEATAEDLLDLKKLENRYPEFCNRARLILKWWYLNQIREQTTLNEKRE